LGQSLEGVTAVVRSSIPELGEPYRGKVRDVYTVDDEHLLIVATDRISAFDFVLGSPIPAKGVILTQLSLFWFDLLKGLTPNHLVTADPAHFPAPLDRYADLLRGRSMLVRKANMVEIECVARGYISGSGWKDYQRTGAICGVALPPGLRESDALPEPIFTPATKAQGGAHDENISFDQAAAITGQPLATQLRERTLAIYRFAADYAAERGILLADTKFEFGFVDDELVLADEVLTPDSSRLWPASEYQPGGPQPSYDKQFVRDYLESIRWNKQPPAPVLPEEVVVHTRAKYLEAFERITGRTLDLTGGI
jgi:phosphoribosylaminoimidazole-succinocarboxamide synthase